MNDLEEALKIVYESLRNLRAVRNQEIGSLEREAIEIREAMLKAEKEEAKEPLNPDEVWIGPYRGQTVISQIDRIKNPEPTRFKVDSLVVAKYAMDDESHISVSKVEDILIHKRYKKFCKSCHLNSKCNRKEKGALLLRTDGKVSMLCEWQVEPAEERDEFAYHMFGPDAHEED